MKIKAKENVKKAEVATTGPRVKTVKTAVKKPVPKTQRVTFNVRAEVGSRVYLAGSFNNWDPTDKEMIDKKGEGFFTATVNLPAGAHQYKFVIDGTWCADPECAEWIQNDHGTLNSVKHVS
jgi:1,4-alpha-glucan branching enzyme